MLRTADKCLSNIKHILNSCGLNLNSRKTCLQHLHNGIIHITGVGIDQNNHVRPTRRTLKRIRAAAHQNNLPQLNGLKEWAKCKFPRHQFKPPAFTQSGSFLISLCLFDLDDTLLRTIDLQQFRGTNNINADPFKYYVEIAKYIGLPQQSDDRYIFTKRSLGQIQTLFPNLKLGIFTKSPREYTSNLLRIFFPDTRWETTVTFEDVHKTKPCPDGIKYAMGSTDTNNCSAVALVGDSADDISAAYRSGARAVLTTCSWNNKFTSDNYHALNKMPDAIIDDHLDLISVLTNPSAFLPELEYQIECGIDYYERKPRFDTINHFFPNGSWQPVTALGRLFNMHSELTLRRKWHCLTNQILINKESQAFPPAWIKATRNYLKYIATGYNYIVTCIPRRHGRIPRMENFIRQLEFSNKNETILDGVNFIFDTDILSYKKQARSNRNDHLSRKERYENAELHLNVTAKNRSIIGKNIIVIDDVVTSGASLLWAHKHLMDHGAREVKLMALAKTIGVT